MNSTNPLKPYAQPLWKNYTFEGIETGNTYTVKCRTRYSVKRIADIRSGMNAAIEAIIRSKREDQKSRIESDIKILASQIKEYDAVIEKSKTIDERKHIIDRKLDAMDRLSALRNQNPDEVSEWERRSFDLGNNIEYIAAITELIFEEVEGGSIKELNDNYDLPPDIYREGMSFFTESVQLLTEEQIRSPEPSETSTGSEQTS